MNRDYPGSWRFVHEEVVDGGDRRVLRAKVTSADGSSDDVHYVASFATLDDEGLLRELVEVWAEVATPEPDRRP